MPTLHCPTCGIATASVSAPSDVPATEGVGHVGAYCTVHHPDPQYHRDLLPPPGRTMMIVTPLPPQK